MSRRRILSLWFPRLAAERVLRAEPDLADRPVAVVADRRGALVLASLSRAAEAPGLRPGMALGDARAICPALVTRPEDPHATGVFRAALRRWAGRFTPWVAEADDGLVLEVTGCTRLFGGEAALAARVAAEAAAFGLSLRLGLADTLGAAWAVARYAGTDGFSRHAGDAIDQEARATRSRAGKRGWERNGPPPPRADDGSGCGPGLGPGLGAGCRIVPAGETLAALGPLPVAALRLAPEEEATLRALGLRRILDVVALPRADLARRVGPGVGRRLDQALGRVPEPVSPARPAPVYALRLSFPEPIGRETDVLAGLDRLLPPLCARLAAAGRGARRVRLVLVRTDGRAEVREAGLARATARPETIRAVLALRLGEIDAGFGIEAMRLEFPETETAAETGAQGPGTAVETGETAAFGDLLGRIGARLGLETLVRLHPAESHLPEKAATEMAAAFTSPAAGWPAPAAPRPILIFPPEPLAPPEGGTLDAIPGETPPATFVWRRRTRRRTAAFGPERIAPEWWLDDPAWRSGPRDYWRVETGEGTRLWIYAARGGETAPGWFAHGLYP